MGTAFEITDFFYKGDKGALADILGILGIEPRAPRRPQDLGEIGADQALHGGLIPVPDRTSYHGADDQGLPRSIADTNQIYCSLFRVISVCEAMHNALISPHIALGDDAALVENLGLVAASDRSVELDAFLVKALGVSPGERHFLRLGAQIFGAWNEECFPALPAEAARRLNEIMGIHAPG